MGGEGRIRVCQNYIHKKAQLFRSFTMLPRTPRTRELVADAGGHWGLAACPRGGCWPCPVTDSSQPASPLGSCQCGLRATCIRITWDASLKMQIPRIHPRPKYSNILGRGLGLSNLKKQPRRFLCPVGFESMTLALQKYRNSSI